ncbi:MAG TPA: hypothetical protein VLZ73_07475, partial [Brevundimonas sp.]|nr:hypothetical protein [Brevundimonas sp.]
MSYQIARRRGLKVQNVGWRPMGAAMFNRILAGSAIGTPVCRDVLARGRHALGLLSVLLTLMLSALPSGVRAQALWFEANIPPAMRGVPYDVQLTPKWGTGTGYVFSATFLPPGINLSPSGRLTGTVTSL